MWEPLQERLTREVFAPTGGTMSQQTTADPQPQKVFTEVVKLLLDLKADIKADGGSGWTPLHVAAKCGVPNSRSVPSSSCTPRAGLG